MKITFSLIFCIISFSAFAQTKSPITLVIHGGAGTITKANMTPEKEKAYNDALEFAMKTGMKVLKNGGTSMDAVEATIRTMEDSPLFNAGKGAVFTHDGTNELDAAVMNGKDLSAGAISGVKTIRNPISAARKVMEKSPHVMMSGIGAEQFAKEQGIEIVDPSYFYTENRWKGLQKAIREEKTELDHVDSTNKSGYFKYDLQDELIFTEGKKFGTVGCVALDQYGNLAAGTSTGGMTNKRYGRIGDAPIIGSGTYANNASCAVSATGHGEFFIRSVVGHDVAALMEYKKWSLKKAADEVVMKKLVKIGGEGGLIALDAKGNVAMPFNSEGMYRGYIKADGTIYIGIYK